MKDFDIFLEDLANGAKSLGPDELISFISMGSVSERVAANKRLAEVYINKGEFLEAKTFVERAWLISNFSSEILPLVIQLNEELKDYVSLREAYKRIGIKEANKGNVVTALTYFNIWQYVFAKYEKTDKYIYDFDILDAVSRLSMPFQDSARDNLKPISGKIRIAYIIYGWAPALHKIDYAIAEFVDKSRFELVFVIPDKIFQNPLHRDFVKKVENFNCSVITADKDDPLSQVLAIKEKIGGFKPHILFNSASITDFWTYFLSLLVSAPLKPALIGGAMPLYISPVFDLGMVESFHITMDSLIDCARVELSLPLPLKKDHLTLTRGILNIPDNAIIIVCGGRPSKFQDQDYWKVIVQILSQENDSYLVIIGPVKHEINFIDSIIPGEVQARIRFLQSREDYLSIYALADIAIDTYPQSGGIMILEAMALGIPMVTFENDYFKLYDQVTMSLAREFNEIPELIVPRNDFNTFKNVVFKLIHDKEYRDKISRLCSEKTHRARGNPANMVKQFEEIFFKLIEEKLQKQSTIESKGQNEKQDVFGNLNVQTLLFNFFRSLGIRFVKKMGR